MQSSVSLRYNELQKDLPDNIMGQHSVFTVINLINALHGFFFPAVLKSHVQCPPTPVVADLSTHPA